MNVKGDSVNKKRKIANLTSYMKVDMKFSIYNKHILSNKKITENILNTSFKWQ